MLQRASRLVARGLLRLVSNGNDWAQFASPLQPGAFGGDHSTPASALQVTLRDVGSLNEMLRRLAEFEKVAAVEMGFGANSAAEAATGLELTGRGNCVAHASWAFAQLARLGHDPTFVVGRWPAAGAREGEFHAWVQFGLDGSVVLLEGMECKAERMLRPLVEVRADYVPLYGATASGATFVYPAFLRARLAG